MVLVKFDHRVKYNGEFQSAHVPFEIANVDEDEMVRLGAFVFDSEPENAHTKPESESLPELANTPAPPKPLQYMNLMEIRNYAEVAGISLEGLDRKDDMIRHIKDVLESE